MVMIGVGGCGQIGGHSSVLMIGRCGCVVMIGVTGRDRWV